MSQTKQQKRLWIVNQYATPPDLPGITRHYSLGKHLVEVGWDVKIFTSNYRHETRKQYIDSIRGKADEVSFDGVKFIFVNQTVKYKSNSFARIANIIEFGKNVYKVMRAQSQVAHPNIILGSSFHFINVESALMLSKRVGAIPILEVRDLWPEALIYLRNLSPNGFLARTLSAESRRLYCLNRGAIALSPAIEKTIKGYCPKKPTLMLPNPIDNDLFLNVDISRWKSLDPINTILNSNAKAKILYIGTIGEANAFEVIYKAAELLREYDIEFYVVGHGEKFNHFRGLAEKQGIKMFFFDPIPKLAVPTLLSLADALVASIHPTFALYGGSMNKLNDYMMAAKPIFYSGPRENTPFDSIDCAEVVDPLDFRSLASRILQFYHSPDAYYQRAQVCNSYAVDFLSSSSLAMRLNSFLNAFF